MVTFRDCAMVLTLGFLVLATTPASADSPCDAAVKALRGVNSYEAVLITGNGGSQATTEYREAQQHPRHRTENGDDRDRFQRLMRINGGAWQTTPVAIGNLASTDPSTFLKSKRTRTCVDTGMGAWHGQPVHVYKETYTSPDGSANRTQCRI